MSRGEICGWTLRMDMKYEDIHQKDHFEGVIDPDSELNTGLKKIFFYVLANYSC